MHDYTNFPWHEEVLFTLDADEKYQKVEPYGNKRDDVILAV